MQKIKFYFLVFVATAVSLATYNPAFSQNCKAKEIAKSCHPNIEKPFKYDSYAISELVFDSKPKKIEVRFTAFKGPTYKMAFCSSGFEEGLTLNVYDKSNSAKNCRKKIYDNGNGIDNDFWSFILPKAGNYYIEYELAPTKDGSVKKGCVIMLIGYIDPDE